MQPNDNDMSGEIKDRILAGNWTCYAINQLFWNQLVTRNIKLIIFDSDNWTLKVSNTNPLRLFDDTY